MTRAPSPISKSATADPIPPAPPAKTTSLPFRVSGMRDVLIKRNVSARHDHKKHGQDFAVPEVVFDDSLDERGHDHGNSTVQQESAIIATRRQGAKAAPEVEQNFADQPQKNEQHGYAPLGG